MVYHEIPGSPRENIGTESQEITRSLQIAWSDRTKFRAAMLGANLPGIQRKPPAADPEFPWLYCVQCNLSGGLGSPVNDPAQYKDIYGGGIVRGDGKAVYECKFAALDYDVPAAPMVQNAGNSDVYFIKLATYGCENFQYAGGTFEFMADDRKVMEARTIQMPTAEITWVWKLLPDGSDKIGRSIFQQYLRKVAGAAGSVNQNQFDDCPAQTLLLLPPEPRRYKGANGAVMYDCALKFSLKLIQGQTWNKFWRGEAPGPGFFDVVAVNNSAITPYPLYDFKNILTYP